MHNLDLLVPAVLGGVMCGPISFVPAIEARQTYDDNTIAHADYRRKHGPSKRNGDHDEMVAYPDCKIQAAYKSGQWQD